MRTLILMLALSGALAGVLLVIGMSLPATREGRADIVIQASPEEILAVVRDFQAQPEWRNVEVVRLGDDQWLEVTPQGERITFTLVTMTNAEVELRFSSTAGYSGTWRAELAPTPGGARVSVTERATVPSPLGRIVSRVMFDPDAFAAEYLVSLKKRAEA
ncbi:MAG: SRPBCC family protein [Brevundimonas sp.]|uniref:SRPBCC family protein n=1 Tax=Brevundimonas sp. TaxID=1871086 RepID=UPI00391C080C